MKIGCGAWIICRGVAPAWNCTWSNPDLIAFDTGERIVTPAALMEAIERMALRSLFYHVHDARRRTAGQSDDFSLWLDKHGAETSLAATLRGIDFYFLNLSQLRQSLIEAFRHYVAEAPPVPRSGP